MNRPDNITFIGAGVALAIIIAICAVFLAASDPDGLESTALYVQGEKSLTGLSPEEGDPEAVGTGVHVYNSPFPDYGMGDDLGQVGGIIAMILGILVTLGVALGIIKIINMNKA
jgi:cobalt/nickel transport protein